MDQLQFGLAHGGMVSRGMEVNMTTPGAADCDGGVLRFCPFKRHYDPDLVSLPVWHV